MFLLNLRGTISTDLRSVRLYCDARCERVPIIARTAVRAGRDGTYVLQCQFRLSSDWRAALDVLKSPEIASFVIDLGCLFWRPVVSHVINDSQPISHSNWCLHGHRNEYQRISQTVGIKGITDN